MDDLTPLLEELRIRTTLFGFADVPSDWGVEFPPGRGSYFHVVLKASPGSASTP